MTQVMTRLRRLLHRPAPAMCWDLEEWTKNSVLEPVFVARDLRDSHVPEFIEPLGNAGGNLRFEPQVGTFKGFLAKLNGVTISGPDGFVIMPDGTFLIEPAWCERNVRLNPAFFKRRWRPARRMAGRWFSCLMYFCYGYYHWICDVLPRFHRILPLLPSDTHFLVPQKMESWKWSSLEALGISRNRCVQFSGKRDWTFEEFYYAPPAAMTGDHDPEAMAWTRASVLEHVEEAECQSSDRLYITRRRAASRRVLNEEEVTQVLSQQGFMIVEAEELTFAEQVATFRKAKWIIGPHGAGLTNMLWSEKRATVIEIFSKASADRRCYWSLANASGHDYRYLLGRDADSGSEAMDIVVPLGLLGEVIPSFREGSAVE